MAVNFLPLDNVLLSQSDTWAQDKETFQKVVQHYLDTKYVGTDSKAVYALFNDAQRKLLNEFFRGFSVEAYRELNGAVELQIQARDAKVRERIKGLEEMTGLAFNTEDWVYDGMVDSGKDSGFRCDLCPRPIRYAHYAVNKKTHDCLRFGCSCAGDFFNIDKNALGSLRTIQANTLRDIKMIAFVVENNQLEGYYRYLCGKTGQIMLEDGLPGLLKLLAFEIDSSILQVAQDDTSRKFNDMLVDCVFASGKREPRPVKWVKENIVLCVNADLDDNFGASLEERKLVPLKLSGKDLHQLNVHPYLGMAERFITAGLPLPLSLCKRINKALSVGASTHHVDYISFAKELLISRNLKDSAVLLRAFSDFIGNYYASVNTGYPRDPELAEWGIRGPKTFYNKVLEWESIYKVLQHCHEVGLKFSEYPGWNMRGYGFRMSNRSAECRVLEKARNYFLVSDPEAVSVDTTLPKYLVNGNRIPLAPGDADVQYFSLYNSAASASREVLASFRRALERCQVSGMTSVGAVTVSEEDKLKHIAELSVRMVRGWSRDVDEDKLIALMKDEGKQEFLDLFVKLHSVYEELPGLNTRVVDLGKAYRLARLKSDRIQSFEEIAARPVGDSLSAVLGDMVALCVPGRMERIPNVFELGIVGVFYLLLDDFSVLDRVFSKYLGVPFTVDPIKGGDQEHRDAFNQALTDLKKVDAEAKKKEEAIKKAEEEAKRVKTPVDSDEHRKLYALIEDRLGFFTVDLVEYRKSHPAYASKGDGAVRRAQLKQVKFLRSYEEGLAFHAELCKPLPAGVHTSEAAKKVIGEYAVKGRVDKRMTEVFRTECYNSGLIFTASKSLFGILQALSSSDCKDWLKEPRYMDLVKKLTDTLSLYYVFRSDLLDHLTELVDIAKVHDSALEQTFTGLLNKVLKGEIPDKLVSVQDILDAYDTAQGPDSSGLTGVDKAEMVVNSSDNGKLQPFLVDICKTVVKYKSCSPKQIGYVNQAFKALGLDAQQVSAKKADDVTKADDTKSVDTDKQVDHPVSTFDADVAKAKEANAKVKAASVKAKDPSKITVRFVNQCKKVLKQDGFWGLDVNVREGIKIVADGGLLDDTTLAQVRAAVDSF